MVFSHPSSLKPQAKEAILLAESYFSDGKYRDARVAYKKALDIAGYTFSGFLERRYRMAIYLARMDQLISQGDSEEVKQLLSIGEKEVWPPETKAIYSAHCQNFILQIEKLMQYRENISQTIVSLKEKKGQEAEILLKNTIRFAKKNQTSLIPIKKALLASLEEGNSESLSIVWQFQQELGIEKKEIQQSLQKEGSSLSVMAKKLLGSHNAEVSQILSQILSLPDKVALAKEYFYTYRDSGSIQEKREKAKIALALYPDFYEIYSYTAQMDMTEGMYQEAKENYDKAQRSYIAETMVFQGWCELQRKNPLEAFKMWNKSIETWPDFSSSHLALGIFYYFLGNPSRSFFHIEKAQAKGTSQETEIMKSLFHNKIKGLEEQIAVVSELHLQGYLYLCHAIALFGMKEKDIAWISLEKAKGIFSKQRSSLLEALAYQSIFAEEGSAIAENSLKELLSDTERQSAIFYSLLYFKEKEKFNEYYEILEDSWKNLWQATQQPLENKDGNNGRK